MESTHLLHLHTWLSGPAGQRLLPLSFALMLLGGGGFLLYMSTQALTDEAKLPFQLQQARTATAYGAVVRTWSNGSPEQVLESIQVFRTATLLFDSIFPFGYGLLGMLVIAQLSKGCHGRRFLSIALTSIFLFAAISDFAENIMSVRLLSTVRTSKDLMSLSKTMFSWVLLFTRTKWILIGSGLLASLVLAVCSLVPRFHSLRKK